MTTEQDAYDAIDAHLIADAVILDAIDAYREYRNDTSDD